MSETLFHPYFVIHAKRHLAGRFKSVIDKDDFSYFARVALPARGHRSGCPNLSSPKACAVAINYVTDVMEVSHSSPKRVFSGKQVFFKVDDMGVSAFQESWVYLGNCLPLRSHAWL